jgi:phage tail-like protein
MGFSADFSASFDFSASLDVSASLGVNVPAPPVGGRRDPLLGFQFRVEIEGLVVGGFSEVDGLETEIEVQEYREGGRNHYIHKRAGPAKSPSNLSLKKGISDSRVLPDWFADVVQGRVERKNISVLMMDTSGEEKVRWNFEKAYPVKWQGPQLRANASEVAVETLELAHKGFRRVR